MSVVNNPKNNTPPGSETSGLTPEAEKQNDRATSQVRARTPADPPAPHYVSHDPRGDPGRADQPWRAPTAVVEQCRDEAADGRTEGGQRVEPKPKGQGKDSLETDDDLSQCSQQQEARLGQLRAGRAQGAHQHQRHDCPAQEEGHHGHLPHGTSQCDGSSGLWNAYSSPLPGAEANTAGVLQVGGADSSSRAKPLRPRSH